MAAVVEGKQYALTSPICKNQSMVFVKLTDSALKAIEDYASSVSKGDVSPTFKPSIEFRSNNSQGVITIPTRLSNNESEKQSYNFSIKDIQNDGILECIQQKQNMAMESLGKILLRMQIHANDDSYQTTKAKMAVAAEQELKKYNTKVINSSDPNVGRKVKVKRSFNSKFQSLTHNNNASTNNSMFGNKPQSNLSMPRFNTKFPSNATSSNHPKTNYANSYHSNGGAFSESIKKLIRETLIHLLAVKPCKLLELMPKVQDKIKEPVDKNAVVSILATIATIKDGAYHLNDAACEEVQLDWLHYCKEERDAIQRRVAQSAESGTNGKSNGNSISPFSDTSVRSLSSPNSVGTSPSVKNSPYNKAAIKRNPDPLHGSALKKFKSDHSRLQVPNGNSHFPSAIGSHHSPLDKSNGHLQPTASDHESPDTRTYLNGNSSSFKSSIPLLNESSTLINKKTDNEKEHYSRVSSYQRLSGNGSGSINSSPNSSPDSGISHNGHVNSDSSANNDAEDFQSKYTKIKSAEQLIKYKSDFNAEFPEYRRLFDYVDSVARQFDELKELVKSREEESEEWHELIRQIIEKYEEVKKSKYHSIQKRLIHLHNKLVHIKNLINEYYRHNDRSLCESRSRYNSPQLK